jgi:hypothetical protein
MASPGQSEQRALLLRRVAKHRQTVEQVQKEFHNLRLFLYASFVLPWPLWLLVNWRIALFGWACCWMFYGAGRYLNFMHQRNARDDLQNAEAALVELESNPDTPHK